MRCGLLLLLVVFALAACDGSKPFRARPTTVPTNHALLSDYQICASALSFASNQPVWDTGQHYKGFVLEAYRRRMSPEHCAKIVKHETASTGRNGRAPSVGKPEYVSSGTGFFVSPDGRLVTNQHVVDGCRILVVDTISDGRHKAKLLSSNEEMDLALLSVRHKATAHSALRPGRSIRVGEQVTVFGFPLTGTLSSQGVATTGNVSALSGLDDNFQILQISAAVQPGNSGGPLLDRNGNVVGVVVAKLNAIRMAELTGDIPQNVNFAIKRLTLQNFLDANNVQYESGVSRKRMETADLVERARQFTVRIECWK